MAGWLFKKSQAMVIGDLVLTEEESQPVMSELFKQGISI
ncbi:DUF1259 domain-containing protein [Bacillus sp. AFS055030]|nr:DUF1259 domain-containing protein [Bacillus sp. AFS055030]PGL69425.1 hypothetical protein CN925_15590 [Bacillus sp. AFS055030]